MFLKEKMARLLKLIFISILGGGLVWSLSFARTLYVKDSITITVRTGPATAYKIMGFLKTGDKVELVERSGDWSLVRFSGDREGWVISRYLTEQVPSPLLVQELKVKQKLQQELIDKLKKENRELKKENKIATDQLAKTKKNFEELKEGAKNYLSLKEEYENSQKRIEELIRSNEQLSFENKLLKETKKLKWFLSGAGVVFGGWLIGFIMGRSGRKKRAGLTFALKE